MGTPGDEPVGREDGLVPRPLTAAGVKGSDMCTVHLASEEKTVKTTTAVGVLGSVVINVMLGVVIAAVFSVTPAARADEVAQCARQHAEASTSHPALERGHEGGHLVAVRMGWEAG
jgi:hypothetical protein